MPSDIHELRKKQLFLLQTQDIARRAIAEDQILNREYAYGVKKYKELDKQIQTYKSPPFWRIDLHFANIFASKSMLLAVTNLETQQEKYKTLIDSRAQKKIDNNFDIKALKQQDANCQVEIKKIRNQIAELELYKQQKIKPSLSKEDTKLLEGKAKNMFQQCYDEAFRLYREKIQRENLGHSQRERTREEKLVCAQRDLMGAYISYCKNPSNTGQATLERRCQAFQTAHIDYLSSNEADDSRKTVHEQRSIEISYVLIQLKEKCNPNLKFSPQELQTKTNQVKTELEDNPSLSSQSTIPGA